MLATTRDTGAVVDAPPRLRALLVEDNPGDARLIREMLRDARGGAHIVLEHADRLAAGLDHAAGADPPDVVLLDLSLPDSHGLETFARLREAAPALPVVVLSGLADESVALGAVQAGAQDYLVKGHVDGDTLVRALRYAIERKRLEEERRALERQKDEFFSNVSHDLRTPLAAIRASAGVLLAHDEITRAAPTARRLLANIEEAAEELGRLVDDLLELTRLQTGRVELWRSYVDLREVVERAARTIEPLADRRQQRLVLDMPEEPLEAFVDADRLGRVLRNLLGNSNKYGREHGTIRVSLQRSEDGVTLGVADDGPGIPLNERQHVFERFYRATDEATRRQPGSGLGLPIARALVELHRGRIWVEDTLGGGATFRVWLPASETDAQR